MSLFSRLPKSKLLRFSLGTGVLGSGIYAYDSNTQEQFIRRNVRTFYNGMALAIDYKLNFNPENTKESNQKLERLHERAANRIFDVIGENGGLYIKMGQVIGTQASMLPPSYQKRAKQLFDSAPAVAYEDVEKVFKQDFDGLQPTDVFAEFDMTPIASASIAQVHKAKLKNGDIVAVKIQKPAIKKQLNSDLWAFRLLLKLYEYAFELPLSFTSDFIEQHIRMETDFENEARNSQKAWENIQKERKLKDKVYIPKVYKELSSKRVLVCEWIDGIQLTNREVLEKNGLDYVEAMQTTVEAFASQIFRSGFVHGDPHPGNVLVRRNPHRKHEPQVVLIDHGLYIQESEKFRLEYCQLWEALFMLDLDKMTEVCKEWGIYDASMFASITLQRPYSGKKAVHTGETVDMKDVYDFQAGMKERIANFLKDQEKFPKELIFISRNMNIMRANNKAVGSPINRINIMARWAVLGLSNEKGTWLSWRSYLFETTLLLLSLSFWLIRFREAANNFIFGSKARGLEDVLDDRMKIQMERQFGMKVDPKFFEG